ncbi:MAG: TraR/DksA family transcriptional regulator [Candidatus Firestonebacteria bacterium]
MKKKKYKKIKKTKKQKSGVKTKKLISKDLKYFKGLLLFQKKDLLEELAKNIANGKKIDPTEVKDSIDLAGDTYDAEFLHNLSDTEKRSLEEIDIALEKIEKGTYGTCEICGKLINKKRLKTLPFTKHDIECQSKEEK